MTFAEYIYNETGYKCMTTFWSDFSIADRFGEAAIKDTFKRAFREWRSNIKYLTELVLVLNHKIWHYYGKNEALCALYNDLWMEADNWAHENITDPADAEYYFKVLD